MHAARARLTTTSRVLRLVLIHRLVTLPWTMSEDAKHGFYQLYPNKLGVIARGIDLKAAVPAAAVEAIQRDVSKHSLVVFKDQGIISGQRHVEISEWFGELESTFYKHPKSPHPDVFRVSNTRQEGCTNVGRTGWHVDGSFQPAPFSYSLYHIVSVPKEGNTVFAPLTKLIDQLDDAKLQRWERLSMVSDIHNDISHPMIYSHPVTGKKVLCFHLGMTEGFVWDLGTPSESLADRSEVLAILREIHHEFVKNDNAIQYSHKWEQGDFIISDNLALGHEASPQTQLPVSEVGLRVMHRTTVKGTTPPVKNYRVPSAPNKREL